MSGVTTDTIETRIPARLDRLPWSRFHWMVVIGLGTVWILDGLEVTMVGSVAARLTESGSGIAISAGQIGTAAAFYVAGACTGALVFGQLTDRFGRKKLFLLTLLVYITATVATAFSFAPWYFFLARFLTGAGIGGEYAAINSAIDELIPARVRGRVDLMINGSYWAGAAVGAIAAVFFLNTAIFATDLGWRLAFGVGAVLGLAILIVRRHVPESPRWLFIHGREEEAERIVDSIESEVEEETGAELEEPEESITVRQRQTIPFRTIGRTAFKLYPRRAVLGLALFVGQAFIYNAITFDLGTLLSEFFDVGSGSVPFYIALFGVSNLLGPLLLGRLFDTVGRKPMITLSYIGSAAVSVVLTLLFVGGTLTVWTFMLLIMATFFLASAGASAAYLTVSEIFPMETRALAIAFFYAVGTAVGGITGPLLFGHLIDTGDEGTVAIGFFLGAAVMTLGGVAELLFGVKAEGQALESIAQPLTAAEAEEGGEESAPGEQAEAAEAGPSSEAFACRAQAAEERARAAEHRAVSRETEARSDEHSRERAEVERALADIADLRARAFDERATEHDEHDAAEAAEDEDGRRAAAERAKAAEERARALFEQAEAAAAGGEGDERRHAALSGAAGERARSREQRALAAEARSDTDDAGEPAAEEARARAERHEAWAEVHAARASAHEAEAEGDGRAAEHHRRQAGELEVRALAADERVAAAGQRREAAALSAEREGTEAARERRRGAAERDERLRSRLERRRRTRRYRLGSGSYSLSSRGMPVSFPAREADDFAREIDALARAVGEHGELDRRELGRLVGARYWGPGRFGQALREAVDEGRIRRLSRSSYGPVQR